MDLRLSLLSERGGWASTKRQESNVVKNSFWKKKSGGKRLGICVRGPSQKTGKTGCRRRVTCEILTTPPSTHRGTGKSNSGEGLYNAGKSADQQKAVKASKTKKKKRGRKKKRTGEKPPTSIKASYPRTGGREGKGKNAFKDLE